MTFFCWFQRVLTTEFIDGIKVDDVAALKARGFSLPDIDKKLFKAFSEQIFHTGFVHADPHPGNGLCSSNTVYINIENILVRV